MAELANMGRGVLSGAATLLSGQRDEDAPSGLPLAPPRYPVPLAPPPRQSQSVSRRSAGKIG